MNREQKLRKLEELVTGSRQAQQVTLRETSGDDVTFSKFQYRSLTQTIFEMTQFKMSCGIYDPL